MQVVRIVLRLETIPHGLAASTDRCIVLSREHANLWLGALPYFGHGIDDPTNETDEDSGDTRDGDWRIEEDQTRYGNWKFVDGSNHGIGCGGRHSDTPRRGVGDEDRGQA